MQWWTRRVRTFETKPVAKGEIESLNATQALIKGFDLTTYQASHVVLIGAGGIGSQVASALVRKGIGNLTIVDDDQVELKNCTRQLFDREDVGHWKAVRLARKLANDGMFPTKIRAIPRRFQEALDLGMTFPTGALLIGGVDNNPSRRALAEYAHQHGQTALHAAISGDGNRAYVMVQKEKEACWGCAFPHFLDDRTYPCNLGGIIDVLQVVSGLLVYAVDTVLTGRHSEWSLREITLDGSMPDRSRQVKKHHACPVCNSGRICDMTSSTLVSA